MAEVALSSLRTSKVPHLALSILTKRANAKSRKLALRPLNPVGRSLLLPVAQTNTFFRRDASTGPAIPALRVRSPPLRASSRTSESRQRDLRASNEQAVPIRSFGGYFWAVSIFGFVLSTYLAYLYSSYKRAIRETAMLDLPQNADVSSRWLDVTRNFDDEVEFSEKLMWLGGKRRKLCKDAVGNVLEVSAGTGRNMEYYNLDSVRTPRDKRIKSLVFNDLSEIMVYQAEKKFDKLQEEKELIAKFRGPVKFVVGDASDRRVITRPEGGFDTIIQTMGVCSMANPVGFLKRLGQLVRQPGEKSAGVDMNLPAEEEKPGHDYGEADKKQNLTEETGGRDKGGKILLLEHGRSYFNFVNRFLDDNAKMHAHRYGCWNNKDIDQVIIDSGLEIESKKRYHFGTTYEYVLRPRGS
ncbi:hypothetical protein PV11_06320 [Exophiala sideris]|uniref:Methyltransferase domain-containing protein n=1 Tax=Exophiala sideris TaxID=1016849 RepID=A0A0D1YCZ7_9EURO|nr:hypothetical protein PV11_06320 [Exophiala sideris]